MSMKPVSMTAFLAPNTVQVPQAGEVAEDRRPTLLESGRELVDVRIGATEPALFYRIPVPEPLLVTIDFQEFSQTSSCALFLSPVDAHPSAETATWQLLSPEPRKQFCIHPADESYQLGDMYLAVRYLEHNGNTFFRLSIRLQGDFMGMWLRRSVFPTPAAPPSAVGGSARGGLSFLSTTLGTANSHHNQTQHQHQQPQPNGVGSSRGSLLVKTSSAAGAMGATTGSDNLAAHNEASAGGAVSCSSLYIGHWRGAQRDGRGVCFYAVTDEAEALLEKQPLSLIRAAYERPYVAWSANSIPIPMEAVTGAPLDENGLSALSGIGSLAEIESGWDIIPLPHEGVEVYDGQWRGGCKQGVGVYQWRDRSYVGEWVGGLREGKGTQVKADGSWYQGSWYHDRRHGYGEALLLPSGTLYRGQWVSGLREGEGSLQYPDGTVIYGVWAADVVRRQIRAEYVDGTVYEGEWTGDKQHGDGVLRDRSGCVHRGTWRDGKREGSGVVEFPDGVVFRGTWEGDKETGGAYHFPNGDVYTGEWDATRMCSEGVGKCVAARGDVYEGTWHAGKRHGFGTMAYADGSHYEGGWEGDKRSGTGTLRDKEGVYEGSFEDDVRSGTGTQKSPDGSFYTGGWRFNFRSGHGVLYDAATDMTYEGVFLSDRLQAEGKSTKNATNETYEGTWLDGLQQGHGTQTLPNGDVVRGVWHRGVPQDGAIEYDGVDGSRYVGGWTNGERSGRGTQTNPDGSVYEGEWRAGKRHGRGRLTRANTESIECEWNDGEMVDGADGTVTFVDGSVYRGDLVGGVPHGRGTLTYPDATVFKGKFEEGIYIL